MSQSYEEIDNIFFKDGYELAKKILGENLTGEKFILLIRTMYENLDQLLDSFIYRLHKEQQALDCKKGCSWCCTQPVFTNHWEVEYLRHFMKKRFTVEKIAEIKAKAEKKNKEVSTLSSSSLLKNRIPCPLLHDNVCSVYPARPMACRIYLSSDLDSCIEEFRNPSHEKNFAKLYDFPLHAGRKLNEGVAKWLTEKEFEVKEYRLEEGICGEW